MNEILEKEIVIKNLIYEFRGKQVMLDSDVAMLYGYKTKRINETVSRNSKRFPKEFCFQLTNTEYSELNSRSQNATLNKNNDQRGTNMKYLPYVFTEQGIAMLSGLLKNDIAIDVSIKIMDAFVEMRKFIINNNNMFKRLTNVEYKLFEHDDKLEELFDKFDKKEDLNKLFFDGQIYDAYSLLIDIIKTSYKKIILIDNYIDKSILDILSYKQIEVTVLLIINQKTKLTELDIDKFNKQYPKIEVKYTNVFHDRYIIIDDHILYHVGASFKDLGNKCLSINKIIDDEYLNSLLKKIEGICVK